MTLYEYCGIIADWLMKHSDAITVLDFFEDGMNCPTEYTLSDVLAADDVRIYDILSERILKLGMKGELNAPIARLYLSKRFESEASVPTDSLNEISFKFG